MGKPIVIYTLVKFEQSDEIDKVIIVCHGSYIDYMQYLLSFYQTRKVDRVIISKITIRI